MLLRLEMYVIELNEVDVEACGIAVMGWFGSECTGKRGLALRLGLLGRVLENVGIDLNKICDIKSILTYDVQI